VCAIVTQANGKRGRETTDEGDHVAKRLRSSNGSKKKQPDRDLAAFVVADDASDDEDWVRLLRVAALRTLATDPEGTRGTTEGEGTENPVRNSQEQPGLRLTRVRVSVRSVSCSGTRAFVLTPNGPVAHSCAS